MNKIPAVRTREEILFDIMQTTSRLYSIRDKDILLERILTEARQALNADAGSIYLVEGKQLVIHYAQNSTLQKRLKPGEKLPFHIFSFPINGTTIAGFAALTKQLVNEPDVYAISSDKQYKFGSISDEATGYKTVSTLTIPLIAISGDVLGVLQMINALDIHDRIRAFTSDDEMFLSHFAANAAATLMHASLTREMILRMVQMAELHDPRETGLHVHRVANYAVEIYDRWAFNHNIHRHEREKFRDSLKIAAMLHDVGKIGISDTILKKPGKLTPEEYQIMQSHTWRGSKLFLSGNSAVDTMSRDIALRHHENWDGTGYPGHISQETGEIVKYNRTHTAAQGLIGTEIPLGARITSLADVYDALSCKRAYKEEWTEDKVLEEIRRLRGVKFDPEIADAFFEIAPRIKEIKERFSEGAAFPDQGLGQIP
ncbi:HD domain-containing protein [Treponema vincentii]|uniref:GAF and HD-GYP domain-containing protein n=1 Tax=Treponema vincentii TaxID=69710 RepID=UPI0020A31813|nr:HD domain-containing phosphohydrolase [Treponema vincentii]UTC45335.1 HD domain-containing protein [Treponema vincentii]